MDAANLTSLTLEQLKTYLSEALVAQHQLMMGAQVASVNHEGRSTSFTAADGARLADYITQLQRAITAKETGTAPRRGPIYVGW